MTHLNENTFFRYLFAFIVLGIIAGIALSDSAVATQVRTAAATALAAINQQGQLK